MHDPDLTAEFQISKAPPSVPYEDVEPEIHRRIEERGRITFAEFMQLALFWPQGGYYSRLNNMGPKGDFYTAPGAHPAFGALISVQAYQMWRLLECPSTFWLVEVGAGDGLFCRDVMTYSANLPQKFHDSLRYICMDRLPVHGVESQLPNEAKNGVTRLAAECIPFRGMQGCVISNELVDSFPVHRVTVLDGALREIYVTLEDGKLGEALGPPSTPRLEERLGSLGILLPEGFTAEINLAMEPWMEEVSSALEQGFVITVDYGQAAAELYSHRRKRGTLTCFYGHTQTDDPYRRIGNQDITAQVDFTSLGQIGVDNGLKPLCFNTQRDFLNNLGLMRLVGRLTTSGLGQREIEANRLGMLDIVRPGGLGEFKVLVQGKNLPHVHSRRSWEGQVSQEAGVGVQDLNMEPPSLWGCRPSSELEALVDGLPLPTLTSQHMPLLEGRYPHLAFRSEELNPLDYP